MYKQTQPTKTTIKGMTLLEGETIEAKVRRITELNEPITDGAPIIFTEREDGVAPEHNIRTDRFELAVEEMDARVKNHIAKRDERIKGKNEGAGTGEQAPPEPPQG